MTELIWDGKYKDGKKQGPVRIALPFQNIETVNESVQERQRSLELFAQGRETEWRNRLIWGDKKYVLPSLLPEFGCPAHSSHIVCSMSISQGQQLSDHNNGLVFCSLRPSSSAPLI